MIALSSTIDIYGHLARVVDTLAGHEWVSLILCQQNISALRWDNVAERWRSTDPTSPVF